MATHSFEKNMEDFVASINDTVLSEDKEKTLSEFRTEVIRYTLKIQKGMGSTAIKSLAHRHNFPSDWSFFKQQYLDMSEYINRHLWKAVVLFVKDTKMSDDNMLASDVNYCLKHLKMEDIEKINKKNINEDCNVGGIDLSTWETGKKKKRNLMEYCQSKTGSLRFLTEYDPAMDSEDFQQDLAVELLRVYNYYEQSAGSKLKAEKANNIPLEERFMKYGETALNNKVLNLKEHYSCESRRRVSTTDSKAYRTRARLKKELSKNPDDPKIAKELAKVEKKLKTSNGDYFSTVTPLVRGNDGEFRELDAREIGNPLVKSIEPTRELEEFLWVEELIQSLPPKLSNFVSILLNHDDAFEIWFNEWSQDKKITYDSNNIDHRIRGAFEYCGVTRDELKKSDKLLKFITRKQKGTWDHFFKDKGRTANQIVVKNHSAGKIMRAFLQDDRDDGTCIFSVTDPKFKGEYDTAFNHEWTVLHRPDQALAN